jgi:anti-anti-sigma regulatory factor
MKRYKFVLKEFISEPEIEDSFRELAKIKFDILVIDFSKLKTIDKIGLEAVINLAKAFRLMGRSAYFCCIPPHIADILSNWDFEFEVMFND